jgi:hypothetical protein
MRILLFPLFLAVAGCAEQAARYHLATNANGNVVWRLDTQTGSLEACGFEGPSKPVCTPFPAPASRK